MEIKVEFDCDLIMGRERGGGELGREVGLAGGDGGGGCSRGTKFHRPVNFT